MKYLGLLICLFIIMGAVVHVGPHLYNDLMSALFVLGGALGFALLKNQSLQMPANFGAGAIYFGWLGTLVGLIAISGNAFGAWESVTAMGPALNVCCSSSRILNACFAATRERGHHQSPHA